MYSGTKVTKKQLFNPTVYMPACGRLFLTTQGAADKLKRQFLEHKKCIGSERSHYTNLLLVAVMVTGDSLLWFRIVVVG